MLECGREAWDFVTALRTPHSVFKERLTMDNRERFQRTLNFQPVDRLPRLEWATWWDKTLERWYEEGLPRELTAGEDLYHYFALDDHRQCWISPDGPACPVPANHGGPLIADRADYLDIKKHLYPEEAFDSAAIEAWAARQRAGKTVVWITLEGFFWWPRKLFGIEPHMYAFYDQPGLMKEINEDLLKFNLRALNKFCAVCTPDFITFAEDMTYNHGPMLSERLFDDFVAPYYARIVPALKDYGILPIIDSDGDIKEIVPWFEKMGIDGFLPLERQAGVDIAELRRDYPQLRIIGGFDKMVMHLGEERMRMEFERLLPVMRQGGYIPSVDHQTPPEVSLKQYRLYLRLLEEYSIKAAKP
jgi:hypothetical protein